MAISAITAGVQTVTTTGATTPTAGLDVSNAGFATNDWTLFVQVVSNRVSKGARIQLEESSDGFATSDVLLMVDIKSGVGAAADKIYSCRKYQFAGTTLFGTVGAFVRANVVTMDSGDSLSLRAWVDQ